MNKNLMMTAAALAATSTVTTPTLAADHTAVIIEHSTVGTFYDQIDLTWHGIFYGEVHDWTTCGIDSRSFGMGIEGKTKSIGRNVVLSDYYKADVSEGYYGEFQLGLPVKSGSVLNAYYTTNGTTVTRYITGFYTLGTSGEKRDGPSTIDALRQYIVRRN